MLTQGRRAIDPYRAVSAAVPADRSETRFLNNAASELALRLARTIYRQR